MAIALLASIPVLAVLWSLPSGGFAAWDHIASVVLLRYLSHTITLMVLTGLAAAVLGISTAWLVTAAEFPGRRWLSWLLILPLASPAYIIAYVYADLLEFAGPVQSALRSLTGWQGGDYWFPPTRSLPGAALILALTLYPYVYLLARSAFASQSLSQFRAARTLGLNPMRAFFTIALPGARPAIAGGLALVLMEVLADFGVADYFAIPTFSTGIFRSWHAMGDKTSALKLAAIMLLFVMLLVWAEAASRRGQVASNDRIAHHGPLITLSRKQAAAAFLFCLVPVALGFGIPVLLLVKLAIETGDSQSWSTLAAYAADTLRLALIVAVIAITVSLLLAYCARQSASRFTRTAIRTATLGYALPGALLAIGLLGPFGIADQWLTQVLRDNFGRTEGLILSGTSAMLIFALTVRFLTVSFNSVSSGMTKIPASMDAAARSLGAAPARLLTKVHLPQLRLSLAAGAALVMIDTLRELPATLILRPFNLETLATRVYRLASDERLAEASTSALLIVLAGLIPVLILTRIQAR
jgi:iron(III) transport system permease protein